MKLNHTLSAKVPALISLAAGLTASFLLLSPAPAHAQGGVPLWTNALPGNPGPRTSIAVDSGGNVFACSSSATVKYSNDGIPLWTNLGGSAIAVDASGKVFVSGINGTVAYSGAGVPLWTNIFSGAIALDSIGNVFVSQNSATVAYSNAGAPRWTNYYVLGYVQTEVNSSGNVFVAGIGSEMGNPGTLIAYSNGGLPLWTNRWSGGLSGITADRNGNVFITGGSAGHYLTIKYSGAGVPLWTNRYNSGLWTPNDSASAIVADSQGNVFVTGSSCGTTGGGASDYATIKYSNSGVPVWTNRYDGPGQYSDYAAAIVVDSAGNVFVTGFSFYDQPGVPRPADWATIAYSNDGVPLWINTYHGPDDLSYFAQAVAVDGLGNVFVTGISEASDFSQHGMTIKYSSSIPPPVILNFQKLNNQLVLSWTNANFILQSAPFANGPFTNVAAATSPYTNSLTAPKQFFRLAE